MILGWSDLGKSQGSQPESSHLVAHGPVSQKACEPEGLGSAAKCSGVGVVRGGAGLPWLSHLWNEHQVPQVTAEVKGFCRLYSFIRFLIQHVFPGVIAFWRR